MKNATTIYKQNVLVLTQIIVILLGTPLFLVLDSPWLASYFSYGQDTTNVIMFFFYSFNVLVAPRKLFWLIILMAICSLFAEILGSWILVLYEYRLKNIPMYIPLGHAIIYATIYYLCRQPLVWHYHLAIEKCLSKFAFIAGFLSLFLLKDVAGFIGYILFLFILNFRKKPLFYLCMFVMVYYVELMGTVFSTWSWYSVLGNHPNFPPIAYTPSGMAGLYILIDLASNSIYFYAQNIIKSLRRLGLSSKIILLEP